MCECVDNEGPGSRDPTVARLTGGEHLDTGAETQRPFAARFQDFDVSGCISTKWPAEGSKPQQMGQEPAGRSGGDETHRAVYFPRCMAEMPVGLTPVAVLKRKPDANSLLSKDKLQIILLRFLSILN